MKMTSVRAGAVALLVMLSAPAAALAEDLTVTTYYPSPRGVYRELRTTDETHLATQGGRVGIGTASPSNTRKLHVVGDARIDGNLCLRGNLQLDTTVGGAYQCSGTCFDVAENFAWATMSAKPPRIGDVVIVDPQHDESLAVTSRPYDSTVAGVISGTPGFVLGADLKGQTIALVGRVPTHVTVENGPIRRGDLLVTSSSPGYAMRGDPDKIRSGMVIGKALGELEEGEGTIVALVNLQ